MHGNFIVFLRFGENILKKIKIIAYLFAQYCKCMYIYNIIITQKYKTMKTLEQVKEILKATFPSVKFINEAVNYICYEINGKWFETEKNYRDNTWEVYKETGSYNRGFKKQVLSTI